MKKVIYSATMVCTALLIGLLGGCFYSHKTVEATPPVAVETAPGAASQSTTSTTSSNNGVVEHHSTTTYTNP